MVSRPSSDPEPDLFSPSTPRSKGAASQAAPSIRRTILPSDLPAALAGLSDAELQQLADVLAGEMQRRKLVPALPIKGDESKPKRRSSAADRGAGSAPLAQGKLNAIRAAVKAGVKPAVIARQFGVSLSAIRKALDD